MIYNETLKYPDGTNKIINLLNIFPVLKIKQVCIYLMQVDKTFNTERAESLINELIKRDTVQQNNEVSLFEERNKMQNLLRIWVLLIFSMKTIKFDAEDIHQKLFSKTAMSTQRLWFAAIILGKT